MPRPPALNTGPNREAKTRLTKEELDSMDTRIKGASREELSKLLKEIKKSLLNPYFEREVNQLEGMVENEKFKLPELISTTRGLLMKLSSHENHKGGMAPTHKFHFHSVQVHGVMVNGRRKTRKNIVQVNGTKGEKRVEVYDSSKKRKTYKNSKKLSVREIANIRRGKFMPGLFKGL
jgi:ribosomal protein L29